MHWDTFKQDNYSAVGGDGGCRVGKVWAGTTSFMPDHKGFKLHSLSEIHPPHFWVNFKKVSILRVDHFCTVQIWVMSLMMPHSGWTKVATAMMMTCLSSSTHSDISVDNSTQTQGHLLQIFTWFWAQWFRWFTTCNNSILNVLIWRFIIYEYGQYWLIAYPPCVRILCS